MKRRSTNLKVSIYADAAGRARVRIKASNGNVVLREAHGPGYESPRYAKRMLDSVFAKLAAGDFEFEGEE